MPRQAKQDILAAIRLGRRYAGPLISYPVSIGDIAGPTVGQYSWLIARPDKNVALQIDRIEINAASAGNYSAQFINRKAVNTLVLTFGSGTGGGLFVRTDATQAGSPAKSAIAPSSSTGVPGLAGLGPLSWRDNAVAGAPPLVIPFTDPIVLWGDDPSELPGFGVAFGAVNTSIIASFHGREWPFDTEQY